LLRINQWLSYIFLPLSQVTVAHRLKKQNSEDTVKHETLSFVPSPGRTIKIEVVQGLLP